MENEVTKNSRGQPRRFQSGEELERAMVDYVQWCIDAQHMPNVAGFCIHCDMTDETFYQQRNYYPESYKKVQLLLETAVINSKYVNEAFRIFYMKNKFKYRDKVETEISTPEPIKIVRLDNLSDEELLTLEALTKKAEVD